MEANIIEESDLFGNKLISKLPLEREALTDILLKMFEGVTLDEFSHLFMDKYTALVEYVQLKNGAETCQNMSLMFNPHRLAITAGNGKKSVYESLKDHGFCSGLARVMLYKEFHKDSTDKLLTHCLGMGINSIQIAGEFPPYVVRDILNKYKINATDKVLDPCSGWGGRMIGTSVVCNNYTSFEPSTKTFMGLHNLFGFIQEIDPTFYAMLNNIPFEESELEHEAYDFAITSPPYYDTEKYSEEETNSLNRYDSFDAWTKGFYIPMIEKTMAALKPGATFILNIGSRKYPLNKVLLDNFSSKHEISKLGAYIVNTNGFGKTGEGETFYAIKK